MDLEFGVLTALIVIAAYMLIQWRDQTSNAGPKYSVVKTSTYANNVGDVQGYPGGRQGAAYTGRTPGDLEGFAADRGKRRRGPMNRVPLGVINPAETLAKLQKDESEAELRELQQIREKQQAASVSLLPNELDASVSALVDRNLLLNSGPVAGTDTRGSSLRNGSLDLRREIPVAREAVSIWNVSTYDSQGYRRPLE